MQYTSFDRILGILCSVLDAYSACLFLPAKQTDGSDEVQDHFIASSFSLGNKLNFHSAIQEGRGLVGWILRTKEPLLVANFDQRQNHLGYYTDNEEHSIKAFMGCSLPGGLGVLCVDSKRQYSFSEKDQKLLHLFSDLLAQLLTEQVGEGTRRTTLKYYAALRTIYSLRHTHIRWAEFLRTFLDLMASVTGFAYCALCTRDPNGESYSFEGESTTLVCKNGEHPSFPMNSGVIGWVFRNAAPIANGDKDGMADMMLVGKGYEIPAFQSVLAMPLVIQRKTRGVLCLAHDIPKELDETTQEFVRMASEHLALFLENLYVKNRLKEMYKHEQERQQNS